MKRSRHRRTKGRRRQDHYGGTLAASLAATRRRVLLMDLDPQCNATMGSCIDKAQRQRGRRRSASRGIRPRRRSSRWAEGGFMLLPAKPYLDRRGSAPPSPCRSAGVKLAPGRCNPSREAFDFIPHRLSRRRSTAHRERLVRPDMSHSQAVRVLLARGLSALPPPGADPAMRRIRALERGVSAAPCSDPRNNQPRQRVARSCHALRRQLFRTIISPPPAPPKQ